MTASATIGVKPLNSPDYVGDEIESRKLAARIREYWRSQGYDLTTSVEYLSAGRHGGVWCIRSDLINGIPQRKLT